MSLMEPQTEPQNTGKQKQCCLLLSVPTVGTLLWWPRMLRLMSSSASVGHTHLQECHQSLRFPECLRKPVLDQKMAVQVGKYLTEMRLESPPAAALSSNIALSSLELHVSKSPCPQSPIARIRAAPHNISIPFPVAGGFQVPWYSRTPRVYTQDRGGICPWRGQWG